MPIKDHNSQIDIIRLVAAMAIIIVHITNPFPTLEFARLARFGTPLFVMISGYLLLTSNTIQDPKVFYSRRFNRLLIPLIFWNVFYYLFDKLSGNHPISLSDFFTRFYNGGTYYHLYFLQLIFGLYLISPVLIKIVNSSLLKFIVPTLLIISHFFITTPLWFLPYIGYYLAGLWVSTWTFKSKLFPILIIILCFSLGIFLDNQNPVFYTHRLSLLMAIPSLLIFHLLFQPSSLTNHIIKFFSLNKLADLSMGVYLVHPLIISLFLIFYPSSIILSFFTTIFLSFTITYLFKKSHFLSRLV